VQPPCWGGEDQHQCLWQLPHLEQLLLFSQLRPLHLLAL
jgi:hypothetical protein